MMLSNALNTRAVTDEAASYFESLTVEEADRLHRIFGIDFEMNDGRLSGIRGVRYGMDLSDQADRTVYFPVLQN